MAGRCAALVAQLDASLQLARDLAAACQSEAADREVAARAVEPVRQRLADLTAVVGGLAPPPPTSVTSLYGKVYQLKKS